MSNKTVFKNNVENLPPEEKQFLWCEPVFVTGLTIFVTLSMALAILLIPKFQDLGSGSLMWAAGLATELLFSVPFYLGTFLLAKVRSNREETYAVTIKVVCALFLLPILPAICLILPWLSACVAFTIYGYWHDNHKS